VVSPLRDKVYVDDTRAIIDINGGDGPDFFQVGQLYKSRRTPSLAGVAPAIVITAECDVLHDDGECYAAALRDAGVPVEYREYPGMIHAFFGMVPAVDDAMNAQRAVWAAFKRAFT